MIAYIVLCLLVKYIDGSVVRSPSNQLTQNLEINEITDLVKIIEGSEHVRIERSYPRLGREALKVTKENESSLSRSAKRLERAALMAPVVIGTATENPKKVEVTVENRHGIRVGKCPEGYVKIGGFCFPNMDY